MKGGEFLIGEQQVEEVFTIQDFSEEDREIARATEEFIDREVLPRIDDIDQQKWDVTLSLFKRAGELGILAIDIPEKYGGLNRSITTSLLVTEKIGKAGSFAVTLAAHTGIGTLPVLFYGNEQQKEKYLPGLASGELRSCYALTEPGAGSDANSGKTSATLSPDGKYYIINGEKIWITNSGFADIIILFARIDNDKNLSAFIVEKSFGGITLGDEEKKMGIKGSSTRQMFFNGTKVPAENLLGERDGGFKIALNILNIGRIKLGAATLGASKYLIKLSVDYAKERRQFGQPIASFGAIKQKIARQLSRQFALESALYRTAGLIEHRIEEAIKEGEGDRARIIGAEEYAIEAAIIKVAGSEILNFIVDEAVQIHGGMGYSAEYPVERAYRDARINRIFEGTNEINRLLIVDMLVRRALKGRLPLMDAVKNAQDALFSHGIPAELSLPEMIKCGKQIILLAAGLAFQKFGQNLRHEQEIILNISDMIIETYLLESAYLASAKYLKKGTALPVHNPIIDLLTCEWINTMTSKATEIAYGFMDDDVRRLFLSAVKRYLKRPEINTVGRSREIAEWCYANI